MEKYFKVFDFKNVKKPPDKKTINFTSFNDYNKILKYKLTIKDYKEIMKSFNLKCNKRKKEDIQHYCINILYLSSKCNIIQKCWRRRLICLFNKTLGPGFYKRSESNNLEDFLTMEPINDLDYYYFFSFRDEDNFIYCFNIISLFQLIQKNFKLNPYNRKPLNIELIDKIYNRIKLNKILGKINNLGPVRPRVYNMEERIQNLFIKINDLGNYSSETWFTELNTYQCCKFLYELYEIWTYRAQLTAQNRYEICPAGNPFSSVPRHLTYQPNTNNQPQPMTLRNVRNHCVNVMEKMVYSSNTQANQNLGALYILSALTLVSEDARNNLQWLYASVVYN
jgi:hypothetical protein